MRKVVLAALAASTALAVPALAAPARTATLSAGSSTFAWDGGPMTGHGPGDGTIPFGHLRCTPVYECDDSLFEIKDAGTLTIEVKAGSGAEDLDLRLYASDAQGGHDGGTSPSPTDDPTIAEDITDKPDAKVTVRNIKPGWYKAQVASYRASDGAYKGTATLAVPGAAPAPVTTPPVTTPTPPSSPPSSSASNDAKAKKAYRRCVKKAKRVKSKRKRARAMKACRKKR